MPDAFDGPAYFTDPCLESRRRKAADAAWDCATLQHSFGLSAARTVSDTQRCVAAESMNLRYARESVISRVNAAIDDGFSVSDNGSVTATPTRTVGTSPQELKELLEYHYWRITGSLADIKTISTVVRPASSTRSQTPAIPCSTTNLIAASLMRWCRMQDRYRRN